MFSFYKEMRSGSMGKQSKDCNATYDQTAKKEGGSKSFGAGVRTRARSRRTSAKASPIETPKDSESSRVSIGAFV